MPRCRGPKPQRRRHRSRCSPAEIGKSGAAAEPVFAAISRGTQWFGEAGNSQKMKLVLNARVDFDDAGHRGERPAGEDAGLHPDQLWSATEGGPLAAPYVKVKLDAIASEQFTLQMQLAHALKDARLALSRPSRTPCRGWKTSPNCGSRRRTRDMPERICLRYISGCRRRQKRSFLPTPERSGHGGHLSRRMGHQFESTVR